MNSAAISYYFRSKKTLVAQALATSLENAFGDWEALLADGSSDRRSALRTVLLELLEGALRFPGITKAHLHDTFIYGSSRTLFAKRFSKFLASLIEERTLRFPDRRHGEVRADVVQMVSAVLFPGIMPELFRGVRGMNFSQAQRRVAYVDSLIERFFTVAHHAPTV